MTLEESVFQKVKIDQEKLPSAGFQKTGDSWRYETDFCDGDFHAILTVDNNLHLSGTVIEKETGEEYLPLRIKEAVGEFTHHVREEYVSLLKTLAIKIGIPVPFQTDQANRIALKITEKYGDVPDFPWRDDSADKYPELSTYGIFRHPDNQKWYSQFMYTAETNIKTVEEKEAEKKRKEQEKLRRAEERKRREEAKKAGKKLPPGKRKKKAEPMEVKKINAINVKVRSQDREKLWKEPGIYAPLYMSQRTWVSIKRI